MDDGEAVLRVLRGDPTPEELAALVLALALARGRDTAPPGGGTRVRGGGTDSAWVRSGRPGAVVAGLPTRRGPRAWRGR